MTRTALVAIAAAVMVPQKRLILLVIVLLCCATRAQSVTITFDPASLSGGSRIITEWVQSGFRFSTPTGMGHTAPFLPGYPSNGTAYLDFGDSNAPLLFRSTEGVSFSLVSVDLAEYSEVFPVPKEITFIGTKLNGTIVAQTFTTDGQIGSGNSWQTFTLPNTFTDLVKVEVPVIGYALDNVVIQPGTAQVPNERPTVTATQDQILAGPGNTALFAVVRDDGLPAGKPLSINWNRVSGPANVAFSAPGNAGTIAQFGTPGVYVLRCTASDGALSQSDDVTITVGTTASAGTLVTFDTLQPNTSYKEWNEAGMKFYLSGTGLMANVPGVYNFWAYNGTANFSAGINTGNNIYFQQSEGKKFALRAIDLSEDGSNSGEARYLRFIGTRTDDSKVQRDILTDGVFDGAGPLIDFQTFTFGPEWENVVRVEIDSLGYAFDNVRVEVTSDAPVNRAPEVDAGGDLEVSPPTFPAPVRLIPGTIQDDGLPVGSQLNVTWSLVAGPAEVSFSDPVFNTIRAEFTKAGTYVVRCTASDGEFSTSDERVVVIRYDNLPPVVDLVSSAQLQFPDTLALHATVTDTTLPGGATLTQSWKKVSGPGDVSFSDSTKTDTEVTFSKPGNYVISLTATDGTLSTTKQVQVAVILSPQAGRYRGLLALSGKSSGIVQATVKPSGQFTATLTFGAQAFRINSTLNADGSWQGELKRGALSLQVSMQFDSTTGRLSVKVKKGEATHSATLALSGLPKSGVPNSQAGGQHTFLLSTGGGGSQNATTGQGFGVLTVRKSGAVAIAGRTPDGRPFSSGSFITPESKFDLYLLLARGKRALTGTVTFENDKESLTDLSGLLSWITRTKDGETVSLSLIGSRFQKYPSYLDPWTGSSKGFAAQFSTGGENRTTATQSVTIQPGGVALVMAPGKMELRLRVYNTGLFLGKFRTFDTGTQTSFVGIVLQRTKQGGGLLLKTASPGWVKLAPQSTSTPTAPSTPNQNPSGTATPTGA